MNAIRYVLSFLIAGLLVTGVATAIVKAGDDSSETTAAAPTTTEAPATTLTTEAAPATTVTTAEPTTSTTAAASGLGASGAGQVPQNDDSARTGGPDLLIPGLALVAFGLAGRRMRRLAA